MAGAREEMPGARNGEARDGESSDRADPLAPPGPAPMPALPAKAPPAASGIRGERREPVSLDILIPHYRDPEGLARSLASVAAQDWPGRYRVLVQDDGSPGADWAAARDMAAAFAARTGQGLHLAANPANLGRPATRNRLLAATEAPFLAWLDCGDVWYPEKLSRQFEALERLVAAGEDPHRLWITCAYDWEEAGRPLRHMAQDATGDPVMALLEGQRLRAYLWTLLGSRQAFAMAGRFDERLPRLQDLDLFLRFVRAGGRIRAAEGGPLCRYFKANAGRDAGDVRRSHRIILAKARPFLLDHPGAAARLSGQGELLAARFAAANGRWRALAGHLARGLAQDPAGAARMVWRRFRRTGKPAPGATEEAAGPARPDRPRPGDMPPGGAPADPGPDAFAAFRPDRRRIAFVIDRLAGRGGGAERVLVETANALALRGHMVEVVTHEPRRGAPFYPLAPGVVLSNLHPPQGRWGVLAGRLRRAAERRLVGRGAPLDALFWQARHGGFHRRLAAHLAATRPDVAVAVLPPAVTALSLAPGEGLRRIASLHNVPSEDFDNPARWDANPRDRRLRRAALARMDAIAVLLPEFRDWFGPDLAPRVTVMPNAVPPVPPARIAAAARGPVVLAVGRLAAVKRHDLLLDAWARVAAGAPGWELRIFGEGPERAALEARIARLGIAGSVRLMGQREDLAREYLSAAILAHPAAFEGFGLAPAEALAAGLPVVGFADCPGLNRLVADGVNGLLLPGGERETRVAALAAALARLMDDAALRRRLGAAGPASMAPYAPKAVAALWEALVMAER